MVVEHVQKHDAGKPDTIFRSTFDFGLALLGDIGTGELLIFFQLADALFKRQVLRIFTGQSGGGQRTRRRGRGVLALAGAIDFDGGGYHAGLAGIADLLPESQCLGVLAGLFSAYLAQLRIERGNLGLQLANQVGQRAHVCALLAGTRAARNRASLGRFLPARALSRNGGQHQERAASCNAFHRPSWIAVPRHIGPLKRSACLHVVLVLPTGSGASPLMTSRIFATNDPTEKGFCKIGGWGDRRLKSALLYSE